MPFTLKQISSLEKVRLMDQPDFPEISRKTVFRGERFSYQTALFTDMQMLAVEISVESPCKDWIKLYAIKNAVMDMPIFPMQPEQEDYITREPGLMPDILVPLEEQNGIVEAFRDLNSSVWVRVDVPEDAPAGEYPITIRATRICEEQMASRGIDMAQKTVEEVTMTMEVLPVTLPKQTLKYTQWFYADCIANAHDVEVYSEKHWELIDKYMAAAVDCGINMMLLPVITPPVDTMYGVRRPCVQLVDIEKVGDTYHFGFEKFHRWIDLCKKNGIRYYEVCHMFSQWGLKWSPNIRIRENGEDSFQFGWHVPASDPGYEAFLRQFLPAVVEELKAEGILQQCYFHISDEPKASHLEDYTRYTNLLKSLLGDVKRLDALSHPEFYEMGLVDIPCVSSSKIKPFLDMELPERFVYYCCSQYIKVSNRFLGMPAYRNRIMGLQMYRWDMDGFLQWGFNYYNSRCSGYPINPYQTTSADLTFPSGDAFSVYPGKNGPVLSMRSQVFYEGVQDMQVCQLLASYIGKDAVKELINREAGMDLQFDEYPRNADYILNLRQKMTEMIRGCLNK